MTGLAEAGLAAMRLTRLIREDAITEGLRERFFRRYPPHLQTTADRACPGPGWKPIETLGGDDAGWYRESKVGPFVSDLLDCPYWCLSVWAGGLVAVASLHPAGRLAVRVLALSQITAVAYDAAIPLPVFMQESVSPSP